MLIPIELISEKKLQTSSNLTFFSKVSLPPDSLLAFHTTFSLFYFNLPFPEKITPFVSFYVSVNYLPFFLLFLLPALNSHNCLAPSTVSLQF